MPVRYGRFEMPKTLSKEEKGATETYAKFVAEPFEAGYGHTVGNSLRRVLLSSLEGAAITAVKITGAQHEFATLPGVVEDVTDIVLNLKRIKFKATEHEPRKLSVSVNKEGEITIKGESPNEASVTKFGQSLEFSNGLFSNLNIETTREAAKSSAPTSQTPAQNDPNIAKPEVVTFTVKASFGSSDKDKESQPVPAPTKQVAKK